MNIQSEVQNGFIVLSIEGRIDSMTSGELQDTVLKTFQKTDKLELDFQGVDYISSAGLRVLLIAQKTAMGKQGSFQLRNVCEQVMNVIKMTGFERILTIL